MVCCCGVRWAAQRVKGGIGCRSPDRAGKSTFNALKEQTRGNETRTVGTYQVFHDGRAGRPDLSRRRRVPLSGTTAESKGPARTTRRDAGAIRAGSCPAAILLRPREVRPTSPTAFAAISRSSEDAGHRAAQDRQPQRHPDPSRQGRVHLVDRLHQSRAPRFPTPTRISTIPAAAAG